MNVEVGREKGGWVYVEGERRDREKQGRVHGQTNGEVSRKNIEREGERKEGRQEVKNITWMAGQIRTWIDRCMEGWVAGQMER